MQLFIIITYQQYCLTELIQIADKDTIILGDNMLEINKYIKMKLNGTKDTETIDRITKKAISKIRNTN